MSFSIEPNKLTNRLYLIIVVLTFFLAIVVILNYQQITIREIERDAEKNLISGQNEKQINRSVCLGEDEVADFDYDTYLYKAKLIKLPIQSTTTIYIKNKNTNEEISKFIIADVATKFLSLQIHKCGVYVIRNFELDKKKGFYNRHELWHYRYNGKGEILMSDEDFALYGFSFRVDPLGKYLVLERGYLGSPDYAIVIKNLQTKKDVFVLTYDDLINKYSAPEGGLSLGIWRDNGKCFGGSIHVAAKTLAFFRIEVDTWKTEVFVVPDEAMTVDSISDSGKYIAYDNGPGWIAIHEHAQQIYKEWREQGKEVSLFLYNLFTKEKIILETIDDPEWDFKTKWLSDTELEYELPNGERKIYRIKE